MTTPPPDDREYAHFEETTMTEPPVPLPAGTTAIAPKVKWGAFGSLIVTAVLTAIAGAVSGGDIVSGVPDALTAVVLSFLASAGTALAGFLAPHQPRVGDDPLLDEIAAEDAGPLSPDYFDGESR